MNVLFVDDDVLVLSGLRRALYPWRHDFSAHFASTVADALETLEATPFDVVVSDMRMPDMDGAALLGRVAALYPATLRIVLSGQTGEDAALRAVAVAHQFLSKPCAVEVLVESIRRGAAQREAEAGGHDLAALVGRVGALPVAPALFVALGNVMSDPDADTADVVAVLQQSPLVVAKLLQLVNSSFFSAPQKISALDVAVTRLGLRLVRAVVLTEGVFAACTGTSSAEQQRMADQTAAATAMTLTMTVAGATRDTALTATLLAQIGIPLLAAVAPELTERIERGIAAGATRIASELEVTGTTHAAFAAHILSLWNLPDDVVDAVARHHLPPTTWDAAAIVSTAWAIAEHAEVDIDLLQEIGAPGAVLALVREHRDERR